MFYSLAVIADKTHMGEPKTNVRRHNIVSTSKWFAFTLSALLLAACGTATPVSTTGVPPTRGTLGSEQFQVGELVKADLPLAPSDPDAAWVRAVVAGDRALGTDLLQEIADEGNLMISPYSIATALSMMYPGARGETAEEIAAVMHLSVDDEQLHAARGHIESELGITTTPPAAEDERAPFAIRPANSAWGQGGYPFLEPFLEVLATHYGAGMRLLDFYNDPAGSTETINTWVEDQTEDRIEDLIPPGAIDEMTRLVLVNAIWFKANWALQFATDQTANGQFTRLDGSEVDVPMMHSGFKIDYSENDRFQFVRLAYAGDAAMVVALPKDERTGPPARLLTPEDWRIGFEVRQVDLTLPRFEFKSDLAMSEQFKALGMETVFIPPSDRSGADLTGIVPDRVLFLSDVFHQTFVAVDEYGTEAAAATAEVFQEVSGELEPPRFTADRPFLFWIEDITTGEPLFLGQVTDPS